VGLGEPPPPLGDEEPTPAWVAATLGISLDEADWLLVRYRFAEQALGTTMAPTQVYFCEPLPESDGSVQESSAKSRLSAKTRSG
jgi:hypothetical protein